MPERPSPSSGRRDAIAVPESLGDADLLFGQLLIRKGYLKPEQLREVLGEQARIRAAGNGELKLGDLLIRKGFATLDQVTEVMKLRDSIVELTCQTCGTSARLLEFNPKLKYVCKAKNAEGQPCRGRMLPPGAAAPTGDTSKRTVSIKAMPADVRDAARDPKRMFGKYILVKELGRGGMGVVYKAWDSSLGRTVAVKVLLDEGTDEEDIQRFFREAQTAASLNHPNIIPVYDVGDVEGKHYIAMQFIEGSTPHRKRIPWKKACEIVRPIALALESAHQQNIIHRDIKPQNIIIDAQGKPYLMDFGLAKSMKGMATLTQSGTVMGTPAYMPPEQARGERHQVGKKSDIYSLGATLYELVTGRPPFHGANPFETMMKVCEDDPVAPTRTVPNLPVDIETVILKAMDKEPARRYASMKALADELTRMLKGDAIHARPLSFAAKMRKKVRKNRAVLLPGVAAIFVLLVGGIVYGLWSAGRQQQFRQRLQEADTLFVREDWQGALTAYGSVLEYDESNALALERIAACQQRIDDRERQARAAAHAAEQQRIRESAQTEDSRRRRDEASRHFDDGRGIVMEAQNDFFRRDADLSRTRESLGRAIAAFDRAIETFPDEAEFWFWRARAQTLLLDYDAALADLGEAITRDARFSSALMARGKIHLERYMQELLHLGWIVGPDERARIMPLVDQAEADFRAAIQAGASEDQRILDALIAFCDNQLQRCLDICDEILGAGTSREEVWKLRADAHHFAVVLDEESLSEPQRDEIRSIIQDYDQAIGARANFYEALIMRGYEHQRIGNLDAALADYDRALSIRPDDPIGLWFRASWNLSQGQQYIRGGATMPPEAREHYEEALQLLSRGLQQREDSYILRMNRAVALGNLGRYPEALLDVDRALELNDSHYFAWYLKGAIIGRDDPAAAIPMIQRALEINQNDPSGWYNLGVMYRALRQWAEARRCFENALSLGHPAADTLRRLIDEAANPPN